MFYLVIITNKNVWWNSKYNWKIYYTIECLSINNSQGSGVGTLKYAAKVKQKMEWNYVWKYAQYTPTMI